MDKELKKIKFLLEEIKKEEEIEKIEEIKKEIEFLFEQIKKEEEIEEIGNLQNSQDLKAR